MICFFWMDILIYLKDIPISPLCISLSLIFVNDILNGHPFMTSLSLSSSLTSQFLLWTSLSPLWTSLTKSGHQYLINGHPIMDIPISLLDITIKLMPFVLHTVMMYYCLVYNPNCIPSSFTIIPIIACSMFVLLWRSVWTMVQSLIARA